MIMTTFTEGLDFTGETRPPGHHLRHEQAGNHRTGLRQLLPRRSPSGEGLAVTTVRRSVKLELTSKPWLSRNQLLNS